MENATLVRKVKQTFILRSKSTGEIYPLEGEVLIGREAECAIPLPSEHISRYHAKITVGPTGVFIEDLQSTNGTYVNGAKIRSQVQIKLGDEIAFDDFVFRLTSSHSGVANETVVSFNRPPQPSPKFEPIPEPAIQPPKAASKKHRDDYEALYEDLDSIPMETGLIPLLDPNLSGFTEDDKTQSPPSKDHPPHTLSQVKPTQWKSLALTIATCSAVVAFTGLVLWLV